MIVEAASSATLMFISLMFILIAIGTCVAALAGLAVFLVKVHDSFERLFERKWPYYIFLAIFVWLFLFGVSLLPPLP